MRAFRPSAGGLRALFAGGSMTGMTDGELLERFRLRTGPADPAAEAAFEALVDRHAAMVWGVCRRSLDRADAEDAFQAVFLVLVRKAGSIRVDDRGSAGRWLYGVARKVSARLRSDVRRRLPALVEPTSGDDPAALAERRDVRNVVLDELDRLPPKYRRPIELCDFDGLTYEQAGLSLGWPTATIKSRLARGRSRLRSRLERRGLAPAAGIVPAWFAREALAGVPKSLVPSTLRTAALASGLVPGAVARLAEGVVRAMFLQKLTPLALLLAAGATTAAVAVARPPREEAPPERPPVIAAAVAVARPSREAAPPERPPVATAAEPRPKSDPRFIHRLDDGTVLEVVAVGVDQPGATTWWRPDGTPLKEAPCDPFIGGRSHAPVAENERPRKFLIRIAKGSETSDAFAKLQAPRQFSRLPVRREGEVVSGLAELGASYPDSQASAVVDFRTATGPWKSVQEWTGGTGTTGESDHRRFVFSEVKHAGTPRWELALAYHIGKNEVIRAVAVDEEGHEHGGTVSAAHTDDLGLLVTTFDLPRERIRKFRVQLRPWTTVAIPDIALNPRPADDPR